MQVRCRHCGRPYAIGRDAVHAMLDQMESDNLKYQVSYCPHCGKRNRHTRKQLQQAAPTWRPASKAPANEAPAGEGPAKEEPAGEETAD